MLQKAAAGNGLTVEMMGGIVQCIQFFNDVEPKAQGIVKCVTVRWSDGPFFCGIQSVNPGDVVHQNPPVVGCRLSTVVGDNSKCQPVSALISALHSHNISVNAEVERRDGGGGQSV